jgi:hypothetical protein
MCYQASVFASLLGTVHSLAQTCICEAVMITWLHERLQHCPQGSAVLLTAHVQPGSLSARSRCVGLTSCFSCVQRKPGTVR